ncbi:hypothetical protein, partial [Kaarinaea lacus]
MAVNELEQRRQRLEEYQVKARFAMAESYDRATKAKQEQQKEKEANRVKQEQQAAEQGHSEKDNTGKAATDNATVKSEATMKTETEGAAQ